jgi:Xaa-Pro aminopeptidase
MSFAARMTRARARLAELDIDAVLLSVGPDLPYLTGYEAMPLERLTMLVLPADGEATLVVPRLEAPRVVERPAVFSLRSWDETDDPVAIAAGLVGGVNAVAIGDRTWARFVIDLQHAMPSTRFTRGGEVMGPLRARKDPAEVEALRRAGAAADRVATELQAGDIELVGRTEAQVSH